jgi:hypothetical protein
VAAFWNRLNTVLLLLVLLALLAVIGMLATGVRGGPLDPPGSPTATMKTLDEIPPVWSRKLPADDGPAGGCASSRFQCVLAGGGVLDRETGLVWAKSPDPNLATWSSAVTVCQASGNAGRAGWRLPTIDELRSLVDTAASVAPFLPAGHPFTSFVTNDAYWSATTVNATTTAQAQQFDSKFMTTLDKSTAHRAWCVRGGQGYDGQ